MKVVFLKILILLAVLVSVTLSTRCEVTNINGIVFRGNDHDVDSRTSLRIPGRGQLMWNGGNLEVDFDLKVSRHGDHFGYVCSIGTGSEIVSLFLTNPKNGLPFLCVVDNGGQIKALRVGKEPIDIYEWNRIRLRLAQSGDSIVISENGERMFSIRRNPGKMPLTVMFGKGYVSGRSCIDVAPIEVRDIHLSLGDGGDYNFPLNRVDTDSIIYDTGNRLDARLENHEWIIDKHSKWKRILSIPHIQKAYPVAKFGSPNLYIVTIDRVVKVDLVKQRVVEYKYRDGSLDMSKVPNHFMIIGPPRDERLVYYEIDDSDASSAHIAWFDFVSSEWSPGIQPKRLSSYINHSRYVTAGDSVIVQMFGYGYHAYKNEFNKIDLVDGHVMSDSMVLADVSPRYMSATGMVDDNHIGIFGGIGNIYGDQEFGTKMFNDLYILDTKTDSLNRLLENNERNNSGIAVDYLIFDSVANTFTGLFFTPFKANTSLILKELNIMTGRLKTLSDSIPYQFSDINSSAMLNHLRQTDMLYAVTVSRNAGNDSYTTDIYTLQLPLLPINAGNAPVVSPARSRGMMWLSVIALMLAGAVVVWRFAGRRRSPHRSLFAAQPVQKIIDIHDEEPQEDVQTQDVPLSAGVSLLGGFKVINREGGNITGSFTPILRQILILIVLYTEKNGEGISNALLKDFLWYDKSDESFLNNRSVNIRKLRVLLPDIGEFKLSASHGNWSLKTDDCKSVDYFAAMMALKSVREKGFGQDFGGIRRVLEYAYHGPLLPEFHFEWLDAFKAEYSDLMIQTLHKSLDSEQLELQDPELALSVSNCILKFDSIDEDAVKAKCRILLKANRVGSAAKAFDRFVREYRTLMNEPFEQNFNEFVG